MKRKEEEQEEEEGEQEEELGQEGVSRRRERREDKCPFYLSEINAYYLIVFLSKHLHRIFTELCRSLWKISVYHLQGKKINKNTNNNKPNQTNMRLEAPCLDIRDRHHRLLERLSALCCFPW